MLAIVFTYLLLRAQSSMTISCDSLQLELGPTTIQTLRHVVNSYTMFWRGVSTGTSPTEAEIKEDSAKKARKADKSYLEQEFVDDIKRGAFVFITGGSSGKKRIVSCVICVHCL